MSFGFGLGDFIAAIQFANKIRKEFIDAPNQFKAISDEYVFENKIMALANFCNYIALEDFRLQLEIPMLPFQESGHESNDFLRQDLESIDKYCHSVLAELQQIIEKNVELGDQAGNSSLRIKRMWKRLKWDADGIKGLRFRINKSSSLLNAFNLRLTQNNVVKLLQHKEDEERRIVLDWITPIDYTSEQNDFIARRQLGTGKWLLNSIEFQEWLKTKQRTLFCPGIPGAGKTILTSIVIENLQEQIQNNSNIGISYVYCNFRRKKNQKAEDLLLSLLKQLTQGQCFLPESVKALYDHHKEKRTRPSFDEISKTFQSVAVIYSRTFIIVDALDECQESNGSRTRFLKEVFAIQAKCGANIFATSRFIPDITTKFIDSISREIRAHDEDIGTYLDSYISKSELKLLKDIREEIKTKIIEAVGGMYAFHYINLFIKLLG